MSQNVENSMIVTESYQPSTPAQKNLPFAASSASAPKKAIKRTIDEVSDEDILTQRYSDRLHTMELEIASWKSKYEAIEQKLEKVLGFLPMIEDLQTTKDLINADSSGNSVDTTKTVLNESAKFWSKFNNLNTYKLSKEIKKQEKKTEEKQKNLIIFGIAELDQVNIESKVNDIMVNLNLKEIKISKIVKFNSNDKTNCPVKIEMNSVDDKFKILKASSQLRNKPNYDKIFIKPDLTKEAQLHEKILRQQRNDLNLKLEYSEGNLKFGKKKLANGSEVRFYYGIRGGQVTEIYKKETNQVAH